MISEIRRKLVHKLISLADAMRMLREESGDDLTEIRKRWLDYELNGYPEFNGLIEQAPFDVPEYRRVAAQFFARTASGIWADVSDTKIAEVAGFCPVPIAIVEDIVANPLNETIDIQLGELLENTPVAMKVHRSQLVKVDEFVRNLLVNLLDELSTAGH